MSDDSINDVYVGSSLSAKDLKNKTHTLTIEGVEKKRFDDGTVKLCLSFKETDRTLILNKTNAKRVAASHGETWTNWAGKVIKIHPEKVQFKADIVDAIRVNLPEGDKGEYDDDPISL